MPKRALLSQKGQFGQVNYSAAKAGLMGFSKSMAQEIASRNITVNVVAPGFIETDMTGDLTDDQKAGILNVVPAGRMGKPEEIAATVAFLASPRSSFTTGTNVVVDGGFTKRVQF